MSDTFAKVLWDKNVIGLAKVSKEGVWLDVNERLCEILEYTQSELKRKKFRDITHPADINDDLVMADMVIKDQIDFYVMSKRYITKTGKVIWIKLRVDPVHDENGLFCYFLSQIDPAREVVSLSEPHTKLKEVRTGWKGFIQENWKWIIVTIIAIGGWALERYDEYNEFKTNQNLILERLEELEGSKKKH